MTSSKFNVLGYSTQMGSDLKRDGMYLELIDNSSEDEIAEVFYCDITGAMKVTLFAHEIPIDAVEGLLIEAKRRLPPAQRNES